MRNYYRVMLGKGSDRAAECFANGFIGTDFGIHEDLSQKLPDEWEEFNERFIPVFLSAHPEKSRIAAGLACGALWTVSKGINQGDIVLSPDGEGSYRAGEVISDYYYAPGQILFHRRKLRWLDVVIRRSEMSEPLQRSTGVPLTVVGPKVMAIYREEIERLIGAVPAVAVVDPDIEDPAAFAMEKHLEEFLVENWSQTLLGKEFAIYEEDGEPVGQQYGTPAGPIDILAISKDKKRLLVVELKRGRTSDAVVGQVLRYMGIVREQVAEPEQSVEGVIIALKEDPKIRWALVHVPSVTFYRYEVSFKLVR